MRKTDAKGRRLVQFYASGGRACKEAVHKHEGHLHKGSPKTKLKKGGKPKMLPASLPTAPVNPMEGRATTGIVARAPKAGRKMPVLGTPMVGALS